MRGCEGVIDDLLVLGAIRLLLFLSFLVLASPAESLPHHSAFDLLL